MPLSILTDTVAPSSTKVLNKVIYSTDKTITHKGSYITENLGYMPTKRDLIENANLLNKHITVKVKDDPERSFELVKNGQTFKAKFEDGITLEKRNTPKEQEQYNLINKSGEITDTFIVTQENGIGKALEHKHYRYNQDGSSLIHTMKCKIEDGIPKIEQNLEVNNRLGNVSNESISEELQKEIQKESINAFTKINERIISVQPEFEKNYENLIFVGY